MKVGDLVEYISRYRDERRRTGIIYCIDYDFDPDMPCKVRWQDHTDSVRDWYAPDELCRVNEDR